MRICVPEEMMQQIEEFIYPPGIGSDSEPFLKVLSRIRRTLQRLFADKYTLFMTTKQYRLFKNDIYPQCKPDYAIKWYLQFVE